MLLRPLPGCTERSDRSLWSPIHTRLVRWESAPIVAHAVPLGFRRLPWLKMIAGRQEVEASVFCGNSEFDELRNRELLIGKHESQAFAAECGGGFIRLLMGYASCSWIVASERARDQRAIVDTAVKTADFTQGRRPETGVHHRQKGRAMPAYFLLRRFLAVRLAFHMSSKISQPR